MGEHAELIAEMGITREQYLNTIRREQPIEELKRKAVKAERLKQKIWTQEDIDLACAEAEVILEKLNLAVLPLADD